ncbi:hypothetical protein OAQ99_01285 [Candidatus Kapabacteria bacterium]|nr:hypothetical protein [Candidatus Kapabacteria bacterium]
MLSPFVNPKSIEIPDEFHSFETKKPFTNCVVCEKNLIEIGIHYFVEKSVKKYPNSSAFDIIFEYAICLECALEMRETLSKDSMEKIDSFFDEKVNLLSRWKSLTRDGKYDINDWVSNCLITNKPVKDLNEYQIYAHCESDRMLFSLMPYVVSGEVIDHVSGLLSQKTKDELDGFMGKYLGPPPSIREILKDKTPVFIF